MPDINQGSCTLVGSQQAMWSCPMWQESSVNGIVTCYSISQGNSCTHYIAELAPAADPRTGSQYKLSGSFNNVSDFIKDYTYDSLLRYCSTSSGEGYFARIFPGVNLSGDEMAVAYTALSMGEHGQSFCVIVDPGEIDLAKLCVEQKWSYKIVNQPLRLN
jgi:hypothetical protein